jgi:sodium/hydrogen exchanger-like protein 6/7
MLFWAGLRGAVAFALAAGLTGESGPAMRTTILVVVVLTVLIFGGTTNRMLQILGIRTGVKEYSDTSSTEEDDEEEECARLHRRSRRGLGRTSSDDSTRQGLLDGDSDFDYDESPHHFQANNGDLSEQSIGGLLSGPIGHPIAEDTPHWFLSFDNKYLKPFFTKRHIHDRNKSIAAYWRAKKRKMERSQDNLLHSFNHMDFTNTSFDEEEFGADEHPLDLNPVGSRPNNSAEDLPPSPSSNIIVGAGRVFGRSIGSTLPFSSLKRSNTPNSGNDTRNKRDGPIHLRSSQ